MNMPLMSRVMRSLVPICMVATWVACGPAERDSRTTAAVHAYCKDLTRTYESLLQWAKLGRYSEVEIIWVSRDSYSNIHRHFELCVNTSALSSDERADVTAEYGHGIRIPVTARLAQAAVSSGQLDAEQEQELEALLEQALKLAQRATGQ